MDSLTIFGLFTVTALVILYALEDHGHWFVFAFAGACMLASTYGFLQGAWPFGLIEAIWALIVLRRWLRHRSAFSVMPYPNYPNPSSRREAPFCNCHCPCMTAEMKGCT